MLPSSESLDAKTTRSLQATVARLEPFSFQPIATSSLDDEQHDTVKPDDHYPTTADSQVSPYASQSSSELTDIKTDTDCAFCTSIGRILNCCQARMNPRSCPQCAKLGQHFTRKDTKHTEELAALRDKVRELEEETPEQRFNRLSVEKNIKIDGLKAEVEKVNKEDESLKAKNDELEKKLKVLEADIKKSQPAAEFTIKEKKKKGKKK
ncbi:hypothetical protein J4E83_002951 [Alternaria metachromatica]|uniref:uncharacterized protein n=1 Tax=Alternaria metachromatica TaxID=283354 RepID=UPI0020C2A542|nr:uncharacterized protein J4E83_002951 [Alternaria metachromatica]KAI4628401.1 hypothetical protein J4E83_002951 [Alternaria metachromatica]